MIRVRKYINPVLRKLGFELVKYSKFTALLERAIERDPDFFFVQIGAHDGVRWDGIYEIVTRRRCKGLVVEPLPEYFERLVVNYKDYPGIKPINVAVHKDKKTATLYRVDPARLEELPDWTAGIASFLPDHHKDDNIPSDCIVEEEVGCVHLMDLLSREQVGKISLLQIDVEGYDAEVIKMIDFTRIKPNLIRFEHRHVEPSEKKSVYERLRREGYKVFEEASEAVAVLEAVDGSV